MPLIALLACATPAPPEPPAPPAPPPTDEQACGSGARDACARLRDRAHAERASGAWRAAAASYGATCAGLPQDVSCVLAARLEAQADDPRLACAETRHPPACAAVAEALARACADEDGAACRVRAEAILAGALPGTSAEAAALLWAGCDADDGFACLALAELVARGEPLPKRARGTVDWLRSQACDLQVAYACAPHRWSPAEAQPTPL